MTPCASAYHCYKLSCSKQAVDVTNKKTEDAISLSTALAHRILSLVSCSLPLDVYKSDSVVVGISSGMHRCQKSNH